MRYFFNFVVVCLSLSYIYQPSILVNSEDFSWENQTGFIFSEMNESGTQIPDFPAIPEIPSGQIIPIDPPVDVPIEVPQVNTGTLPIWSGDLNTWIIVVPVTTWLQYGDIIITEVFPSSWNCLDEFVKLHFSVAYQWMVELYGLGTTSASVKVFVDAWAWEDLIIADSIAGMIPNDNILLVSTVTLTNGGEVLKVIISWTVLDEVKYSGLVGTQSLVYTQLSGAQRLFTTNIPGSPATTCNVLPSPVQLTWGLWYCDIKLDQMSYLGTGSYSLSFQSVWQSLTWCLTNNSLSGERIVNGISLPLSQCTLNIQTQLGANIVELKLYGNNGTLSCYDQFVFATNYDIGTVKQYVTSNTGSEKEVCKEAPNSQNYSDCGLQFQWSKLWFFAGYSFNFVSVLHGKQLSNTQKSYTCSIDMGDGTYLDQCNPPSYIYQKPWIYSVNLEILDKNTNTLLCKTRTFVNAPIKKTEATNWYEYRYALNMKLSDYCEAVNLDGQDQYETEEDAPICSIASVKELCASLQTTGYVEVIIPTEQVEGSQCDTGLQDLRLYSVLPNPKGSDSEFEQFTLYYSGLNMLSDMSNYSVQVGKKSIVLSGSTAWSSFITFTGGWSLVNNGMCITLSHSSCGIIQKQCYPTVKEGQEYIFGMTGETLNTESTPSSVKTRIAKLNNKITAPQFKSSTNKKVELSCSEKISIAKQKEKVKYDKLKVSRANDKIKYKNSLDLRTLKERIARNNRSLYEKMNKVILQTLKADRPWVLEQSSINSVASSAHFLESLISSGYIYTIKDSIKHSYKYLNNIWSYLNQKENPTTLDIVYSDLGDYLQLLNRYSINKESVQKIKK